MLQVYDQFGFAHPSKAEFDKMFGKYFETFAKVADRIGKRSATTIHGDLDSALERIRKKLPEDFGEVSRGSALAADKPQEAKEVLEAVSRRPGASVGAQVRAAAAMRDRLHMYGESIRALEAALQLATKESGDSSEESATIRAELATSLLMVGDLPRAEDTIAAAIVWFEAQAPRDERALAIHYATRASIRRHRGDLGGAEEDIARSIAWGDAQAPRDERSLAIDYATRASIRQDRGDFVGAEEDIARSIAWTESHAPHNERDLAIDYSRRASIRQDRGDLGGAEEDIARSIVWFESNLPGHLQRGAINYRLQARILAAAANWHEAERSIDRALAAHEEIFGKEHVSTKKARVWQRAIKAHSVPPRWIDTHPD
jgi:tetratricopeptide (TPR) repeat protein